MRPANRDLALAWFRFTQGFTTERPTPPPEKEARFKEIVKDLEYFGVFDPEDGFRRDESGRLYPVRQPGRSRKKEMEQPEALRKFNESADPNPMVPERGDDRSGGAGKKWHQAAKLSPWFANWFGDSKVVDAKGNPKVVFHGTRSSFDAFDPKEVGSNFRADDRGFFFTTDPGEASDYAEGDTVGANKRDGANVMPVYLSIQRPLLINEAFLAGEGMGGVLGKSEDTITFWDNYQALIHQWATDAKADGVIIEDQSEDVAVNGEPRQLLVAFKPEQIKSAISNSGMFDPANPNILFEDDKGDGTGPRGYTERLTEGFLKVYRVALNKNADLSTFLHESGHVFLEQFAELAALPDAPERVRKDFAKTLEWFGVSDWKDVTTEHHEKFAGSFEQYLLEGKAPSASLVGAFERFRLWLKDIYRSIAPRDADLNDEIRGVFDRLLATDAEIEQVKGSMGLRPLYSSPEQAGMTGPEWAEYLQEQVKATSHASRQAEVRVLRERLRANTEWWKAEEAKLREEAGLAFEELPARKAQVLIATAGDDRSTWAMDEIADLAGYPTGAAMLAEVAVLPEKTAWAAARAAEQMRERHPDLLSDKEAMADLVGKGLHGDFTAKWLLREWGGLRRKAGLGPPPIDAIKRAAKQIVDRRAVGTLNASAALRSERTAADKTAKAVAKGDFAQAHVLKQQQLLNMFMYRELLEARELREGFLDLASELSKDKARAKLGKSDGVYRDGVDSLLESFGLKDKEAREAPLPSIAEVVGQMTADASTVLFDPELIGQLVAREVEWKQLSVAELRELDGALRNIRGAARTRSTVLVDGKRADKERVISEAIAEAKKHLPKVIRLASSKSAASPLEKFAGGWRAFDGALLKIETMVGWLGGDNVESTMFKAFVKPLQAAKAREVDLLNGKVKPLIDAFEKMPKAVRARAMEKIDGAALFPGHAVRSGQELAPPSRRFELLMLVLNAGNESNLSRLTEGRNITVDQVEAAANLLTKEELDWVQAVWDAAESLWPESRALEERLSGLAPPKIAPRPLVTKHGTYRGGYFPAIYDSRVEAAGKRSEGQDLAALMDPSFTRPGTSHGHLKSRVEGFAGAISLEPSAIPMHLAKVAHDLAYREAVMSVGSLVMNPEIQATLSDRLGVERAEQFLPWLKDVGQMRGVEGAVHAGWFLRRMREIKGNTVISALGLAVPNMIEDLSNIVAAVPRTDLKAKHLAAGLAEFLNPANDARAMAHEKSGELRTRRGQMQRELQRAVKKMTSKGLLSRGPMEWVKHHAFDLMEASDWATSTPIWIGAYRQALAEGATEEGAVTKADSTIRKVFPSHSPVDQSGIVRDKGIIGTSLMFYGFLNTYYNGLRDLQRQVGTADGKWASAKVGGRALGYMLAVGVLSEFLRGRGREPGEEWEHWFLRKLLATGLTSVPGGGDLANLVEAKAMGKQSNPRSVSIVGVAAGLYDGLERASDDTKAGDKRVEALVRGLAPILGLPVSQPLRTGKYIEGLVSGDRAAADPFEAASGLIYGEKDEQPATPLRPGAE